MMLSKPFDNFELLSANASHHDKSLTPDELFCLKSKRLYFFISNTHKNDVQGQSRSAVWLSQVSFIF